MRIPSPYRNNPPKKKKRRFERDSAEPETSGDVSDLLKSARGIVAALAVVAIIGGACFTRSCGSSGNLSTDGKYNIACRDLLYMGIALNEFQREHRAFPHHGRRPGRAGKNPGITGWNGPYLVTPTYDPWLDPWKRMYRYSCSNGTSVVLLTCGADGVAGTATTESARTSTSRPGPPRGSIAEMEGRTSAPEPDAPDPE